MKWEELVTYNKFLWKETVSISSSPNEYSTCLGNLIKPKRYNSDIREQAMRFSQLKMIGI